MTDAEDRAEDTSSHGQAILGRDSVRRWLALSGLWTMHVWIYWFNLTPLRAGLEVPAWHDIYGVMTVTLLMTAALFARRNPVAPPSERLELPLTALMCICVVSTAVQGVAGSTSLVWAASNITVAGICMSWGYLRWFSLYADLGIRESVLCLFLSYIVGSTIKIPFDLVPGIAGAFMALALPIVSLVLMRSARTMLRGASCSDGNDGETRRGEVLYSWSSISSLGRIALCVFVFCLARHVVPASSGQADQIVGHLIEIAFSFIVLTWVVRLNRSLDFPQLWRFVFLFLSTAIALGCLGIAAGVVSLCLHVVTSLIVMLLWLLLADVAHHADIHPYSIFGLGWSLYVGGSYLSEVLGTLVLASSPTMGVAGGVAALWALGITMVFCLETRDPDVRRIFADLRGKVAPEEYASLDERCAAVAQQCGLTDRELDVLKLLARGRSKNFIAEALNISENTVRGHARNIYSKLGVHTRDELQNRLEA